LLDAVNAEKKDYGFYDILKDEPIRQWLKFYSDWYTFPQVYLNKKIVGGVDVMVNLIKEEKAKM
jgi:glutaredoxin-related protein